MEENDVQLQLKKRARRRVVGAVAFVSVVAVVLPMVMDHEPRQVVHDVEIRIPGQDEKPFAPKFAVAPVEKSPEVASVEPAVKVTPPVLVKPAEAAKEKPADVVPEKTAVKLEKPVEKTPPKPVEKPPAKAEDAKRAAAILSGQSADAKPAEKSGQYVILIGAFSNEANVKNLNSKLGEQGIKTFSEPLDTPQGKKTRVRAGPFSTREAAEKALEKMQRIGVSGTVAAKQ
jgi:DedD protein